MATQDLRILAIHDHTLLVESEEAQACGGCRGRAGCAQAGGWPQEIHIDPALVAGLRVHDSVRLELPSGELLRMAVTVYLPPALGLLLGLVVGSSAGGDGAGGIGAILGCAAGFGLTRLIGRRAAPVQHRLIAHRAGEPAQRGGGQ